MEVYKKRVIKQTSFQKISYSYIRVCKQGLSVNTFQLNDKLYPLVYGGDVPNTTAGFDSSESR